MNDSTPVTPTTDTAVCPICAKVFPLSRTQRRSRDDYGQRRFYCSAAHGKLASLGSKRPPSQYTGRAPEQAG